MFLDNFSASFSRNMLVGKSVIRSDDGVIPACEGTTKVGKDLHYCFILYLISKYKNVIQVNSI